MERNTIAKTLRTIGVIEVICGIILFICAMAVDSDFLAWGVAIIVTSFITCMMFVGFAEIIDLLQASKEQQKEILAYLKKRESKERNAHRTVIQDIESNLPEM